MVATLELDKSLAAEQVNGAVRYKDDAEQAEHPRHYAIGDLSKDATDFLQERSGMLARRGNRDGYDDERRRIAKVVYGQDHKRIDDRKVGTEDLVDDREIRYRKRYADEIDDRTKRE